MIKLYTKKDEDNLFNLIMSEKEEWCDYTSSEGKKNYIKALNHSIVYVYFEDNDLVAYIRCKEDDGFGIYIYDLLVRHDKRGNQIGKTLIEYVKSEYNNQSIYCMSDADAYYEKLGYIKIGSIFEI